LGASSDRSFAAIAVQVAAALAVLLCACGSSSVHALLSIGHSGRWVALVLLLAASAWWAWDRRAAASVDLAVVASAVFFVALSAVSSAWSVDPRLTFERAVTLGVLALVALLIAQAVAGRPSAGERVLVGLLAGCVLVAIGGLIVLAVSHHDAVEVATTDLPPRFKGLGQDPNTASLLFGMAVPAATWLVGSAQTVARRVAFGAALALLVGSIVASGSHGAVLAGAVGAGVVVLVLPARSRSRFALALAVAGAAGVGLWIETLPQPSATNPVVASAVPVPPPKPGYVDAQVNTPLDGELGIPLPGRSLRRNLTTSSGRTQAWKGAIHQAEQRPVAGYGYGTEANVFIDRWSTFSGGLPENSYIGIALQLGVAGLVAFAILLAALGRASVAQLRRRAPLVVAGLGVLAAGLVAAVFQSYIYSVGNVATLTVWVGAFLLASRETLHD
jgi:O-antigen ligase/polysaccharide polymerase Wzy-like membrane protein